MKTQMSSFRSFLLKSLLLIGMVVLLGGCGEIRYQLVIYAEPELEDADVYIDNVLVKSSVDSLVGLNLTYEKHELKVIQKGYKPFVAILEPPTSEERSERAFEVKFEPLGSVPPSPSETSNISK